MPIAIYGSAQHAHREHTDIEMMLMMKPRDAACRNLSFRKARNKRFEGHRLFSNMPGEDADKMHDIEGR